MHISIPLQTTVETISVTNERVGRLLAEFSFALRSLPPSEVAGLVASVPVDFGLSVFRRGSNLGALVKSTANTAIGGAVGARAAWKQEQFVEYMGKGIGAGAARAVYLLKVGKTHFAEFRSDPYTKCTTLAVMALVAIASSGGADGNGGLPDLDIPLLGIGAHRSPLTHSVLIGAGIETLIATFIRIALAVHSKLPDNHDPVWTSLGNNAAPLLEAISRGASLGVSYHLLVDGLSQPAPYHGLPVELPLEVHQAIFAVNGVAEGIDACKRPPLVEKTDAMISQHLQLLKQPFEIEPEVMELLGPGQADILERQGTWMLALSIGEIPPISKDQVRFLEVAWESRPPQSAAEKAWVAYGNLIRSAFIQPDHW